MHTHHTTALPAPFRLVEIRSSQIFRVDSRTGREIEEARLIARLIGSFNTLDDLCRQRLTAYSGGIRIAMRASFITLIDERSREGLIVLDGFGDPVPVAAILGSIERARAEKRREGVTPSFRFRSHRRRGGHMFRHIRTTSERRANQEDQLAGYHVPVHGRRRRLPSAWDDVPVASREDRNWKGFRKTRWKPVE